MKTRSPVLGYNHNVRYAGRLWHVQTEDSGTQNPRLFTHLFHEGTILATKRLDYDPVLDEPAVQKLMQGQHKAMLRELKAGAFDEKISRFLGAPIERDARRDTDPSMDAISPEITMEAPPEDADENPPEPQLVDPGEEFGAEPTSSAAGPKTDPRMRTVPSTDPGSLPPVMERRVTPAAPPPRPSPPPGLAPRSGVLSSPTGPRPVVPPPSSTERPTASAAPPDASTRPPTARPGAISPQAPTSRAVASGTPTSVRRPTGGVSSTVVRPPGTIGPPSGPSRPAAPPRSAALGIGGRRSPGQATPYGGNKPTAEGVVVARPAVIVGGERPMSSGGSSSGAAEPRQSVSRWHQASTPTVQEKPGASPAPDNIFGGDVISEKSLDEVILAYLSEDLSDGKK